MNKQKIYHLDDRTMKYITMTQIKLQHEYLNLPGEFYSRYPQEIIFPNMKSCRVDEYYSTKEGLLINLEEENGPITDDKLEKYYNYMIFGIYKYNLDVYTVVLCHEDPKRDFNCYGHDASCYMKVHYVYFTQDELWEKYDNVISKIEHKIELDDNEALDLAFLGKFISNKNAQFVLESIIKVFNDSIIPKQKLKMDVAVVIGGMILKHFPDVKKQKQLLERLKMNVYKSEMEKLLYEEFGDELIKKDEEIEIMAQKLASKNAELSSKDAQIASKDLEISKLKEEIKNISKREHLNSSEIKDILNSLLNN